MKPMITCYHYGSKRQRREGLRIGAARQVPRGIRREDWQRRNYFDLWLPLVAPTSDLFSNYRHNRISFPAFARQYKSQMKRAESRQVIELLASVALFQPISVGCYCEDEARCHRSLLRELIIKKAKVKSVGFSALRRDSLPGDRIRFASPVCFADDSQE
jgi:uncharacterized protein YeaO (DUF488 family)